MATVFTINPAFFGLRSAGGKDFLGGELWQSPNLRVPLQYNNNPIWLPGLWNPLNNVKEAASKIVPLSKKYPPPWVYYGHSMGGAVINWWLRNIHSGLDPALTTFIVTGDPEQRYNGIYNIPGSGAVVAYGGKGVPAGGMYKYINAQRQYDYYGDHPNNLNNATAVKNIKAGQAVHLDYSMCSLLDPNNRTYVPPDSPNHQYILFANPLLPMYDTLFANPDRAVAKDATDRPVVEAAYTRPAALTPPLPAQYAPPAKRSVKRSGWFSSGDSPA